MCPDSSKCVRTVQNMSGQLKMCPDSSNCARGQFKMCADSSKYVRKVQHVSGQLKIWHHSWNMSGQFKYILIFQKVRVQTHGHKHKRTYFLLEWLTLLASSLFKFLWGVRGHFGRWEVLIQRNRIQNFRLLGPKLWIWKPREILADRIKYLIWSTPYVHN